MKIRNKTTKTKTTLTTLLAHAISRSWPYGIHNLHGYQSFDIHLIYFNLSQVRCWKQCLNYRDVVGWRPPQPFSWPTNKYLDYVLQRVRSYLFYDQLGTPISRHSDCSVKLITAHNLTPVKRDDWNATGVCLSHTHVPRITHRRSHSWNKHVSTRPGEYYASLHSLNTLWRNVYIRGVRKWLLLFPFQWSHSHPHPFPCVHLIPSPIFFPYQYSRFLCSFPSIWTFGNDESW